MTKKDYQAIARAIHVVRQIRPAFSQRFDGQCSAFESLMCELTDVMAADNPRFDRARFVEACETGATRGMHKKEV
jgi:hypothetical protein